jgi:transposase
VCLISGFSFENLRADKGYDRDRFRASIAHEHAQAVIPSNRSPARATSCCHLLMELLSSTYGKIPLHYEPSRLGANAQRNHG